MSLASPLVPQGATDCHMHVYRGAGSVPSPFPVPVADVPAYRGVMRRLGLARVVVVQSMLYGTDNAIMLDALRQLGSIARGVAVVGPEPSRRDLDQLAEAGVRGARAFMLEGGSYAWADLPDLSRRIAPLGWHLNVQLDGRSIADVAPMMRELACPVAIDHVGKFLEPVPADHPAVTALRRLVGAGRCWVKLSGLYETSRSGPPDYADVAAVARLLAADAPERMLWGSNWPHPNLRPPPDDLAMLNLLERLVPGEQARRQVLVDNPAQLFGFPPLAEGGAHGPH